jgi:hypothetical protein
MEKSQKDLLYTAFGGDFFLSCNHIKLKLKNYKADKVSGTSKQFMKVKEEESLRMRSQVALQLHQNELKYVEQLEAAVNVRTIDFH